MAEEAAGTALATAKIGGRSARRTRCRRRRWATPASGPSDTLLLRLPGGHSHPLPRFDLRTYWNAWLA